MPMQHAVDLMPYNTLALPSTAAHYLRVTAVTQLAHPAVADLPRFVLGGGSNVVLTSDLDERLVLHMAILGKRLIGEDAEAWYVEAGAGEHWSDFVQWTLARGWPGLENLSLIPGTVGAAPIQNIGAYGLEVGDCLHSVSAWHFKKKTTITLSKQDCQFGYRDSVFKQNQWHLSGDVAVTSVCFKLLKRWQANTRYADVQDELAARSILMPTPQDVAQAVIAVRQRKLPNPCTMPNVGSFFHNPVLVKQQAEALKTQHPLLPCYPQPNGRIKVAAGWLIEQAGWKGKSLGPVGMYEKQALVLVNHSQGCGQDVLTTMRAVQDAVWEKFAVSLQPEPVFLP